MAKNRKSDLCAQSETILAEVLAKSNIVWLKQLRWAQGSFVEAEAEDKAERSRPRRGRVKSTLFLSFWYRAQCTCSSYVLLLCGQWHLSMKNTTEKFNKSISNTRPSQNRGRYYEAEPRKVETEARPCEAEARPSQLKNCLEAASSRGRCLEDSIPGLKAHSSLFPDSAIHSCSSHHQHCTGRENMQNVSMFIMDNSLTYWENCCRSSGQQWSTQWCGPRPSVLGPDRSETKKSVLVLVLEVW